jgi:hypothetical protein
LLQADRSKPAFSSKTTPRSVLAKALTERVERRISDGGDLYNPAPADCPDIQPTY